MRETMRQAGYALLLSAALHLVGAVLTGFEGVGLFLLFPAVLYTAFYAGLARGWLWVAWIALVCMLGGMAGTLAELLRPSPVPGAILWGILAADAVAAVLLFAAIWRGREAERG